MEINSLIKKGKINAFNCLDVEHYSPSTFDCFVKIRDDYSDITVKNYILSKVSCEDKRILDSLKLVSLQEQVLLKSMQVLSSSEIIKVELAILLIKNTDYIVLYQFDYYFMEKELLFFKKLFKKLVRNFHKTIVLIDSRLDFMIDLVDRIVVKNSRNELEVFANPDFYNENLLRLLGTPKIVEFVKYVNQNQKKLNTYLDIKELIKAIYREV